MLGDKWLPTPSSFSIQSPATNLHADARVPDLIDRDLRGWNHALIQESFSAEEAKVIIGIPLFPSLPPDIIIWNGTASGIFSVRSAYHLGMEMQRCSNGECSNPVDRSDMWKQIWALKVPNTVKIFLWKASHNLLPTKQNMFVRGIVEDSFCPYCKIYEESTLHALWCCPGAQDVWDSGSALFQKCPTDVYNVTDLLEFLMHRLDMDNLSLMATLARRIWLRRNHLVFEGMYTPPNVVYEDVVLACEDFHRSTLPEIAHSNIEGSVPRGSMAWKPPHRGVMKANWDASLNKTTSYIGLGCVVWEKCWESNASIKNG